MNQDLVGREFPPTAPYLVGREKVREFARAVFADAPQHTDLKAARAAGFSDVVAPPTFAMARSVAVLSLVMIICITTSRSVGCRPRSW